MENCFQSAGTAPDREYELRLTISEAAEPNDRNIILEPSRILVDTVFEFRTEILGRRTSLTLNDQRVSL